MKRPWPRNRRGSSKRRTGWPIPYLFMTFSLRRLAALYDPFRTWASAVGTLSLPRRDSEKAFERRRVGQQGRTRALMHDAATFQDQRAVGDGQDLLGVLLDDEGSQSLLAEQARQGGQKLLDDDRRQAFGRLVEQQQARIGGERTADRQHLLLAARQRAAALPPPLAQAREEIEYTFEGPGSRPSHGREVLLDAQRAEDVALLRHPTDAERRPRLGRQGGDLAARQRNRAGEATSHPDQAVDQGRLAHTVAAEHGQRLALAQAERHLGQHYGAAVAGREIVDGEQVSHRGSRPDRPHVPADRWRSPRVRLQPAGRRRPAPRCGSQS